MCSTLICIKILSFGWELETASFYNMTQNGLIGVGLWSIRYPCVNKNNDTEKDKEGNERVLETVCIITTVTLE